MGRFDQKEITPKENKTELEKQQEEMLNKESEATKADVTPAQTVKEGKTIEYADRTTNQAVRVTLRIPKLIYDTLKVVCKRDDDSLNTVILKACVDYLGKSKQQTFIKKWNRIQ